MITFHLFCKNLGQVGIVTEYSKIPFIVGNTDYKNFLVELVKTKDCSYTRFLFRKKMFNFESLEVKGLRSKGPSSRLLQMSIFHKGPKDYKK